MATAALVESMGALTVEEHQGSATEIAVLFKVAGAPAFELEIDRGAAARDVKKLAKELCGIEPEHMRLIYEGRVLKEGDTLECYKRDSDTPVQIMFTAGHSALLGGSKGNQVQHNPFSLPVAACPGRRATAPRGSVAVQDGSTSLSDFALPTSFPPEMAAALVDSMGALTLDASKEEAAVSGTMEVQFKVAGMGAFELQLEPTVAVRDVKKFAKEECGIEPEHMRLIYEGRVLKDADTLDCYEEGAGKPVQVHFTAGHSALLGGSKPTVTQRNPFALPVRGLPGSKGNRTSRMSGRLGGMALIRKYGILMKRQEFREKAPEIGFVKYR
eukprot:CAMPEP_0115199894 /NCGR_PEP_ID=MMETSP0270-20121206/16848_1 /TAXON_ID=71861 /ORGANISM="Scrippsiella trochoidea, Strain CCMP3099" /LENGTH=327 /DNA_ID=CAMNT_0002613295 /DNA_START=87 /DNA_END=1071 /DNA_ORIENTATION=+